MVASLTVAELLQDNSGIRQALANDLQLCSDASLVVHGLTIDYFRQSPTRISAQYTLDLESSKGVRDSQIITVTHFTDGRMDHQWTRLQAETPDAGHPIGPFNLPGAHFAPELQSIVQAFPFDARVPGPRKIVEGSPEIRNLIARTGQGSIVAWQANVVRYRPDMRAMASFDVTFSHDDQTDTRRIYAKAYREAEEGQRAYDLLYALAEHAGVADDFRVPRPLGYDVGLRTLLIDEAPGERLLDIIRQHDDRRAPEAVRRAALAVAAMHNADVALDLLPDKSPDKDLQFADATAGLEQQIPQHGVAVHTVADQIDAAFRPAPPRPTHYDLKQGHIMVDAESVTILDFDKMAIGDPLVDVANVVATLSAEREGSAKRAARRQNLADIFVNEYFSQMPGDWATLFPAHLARATLLEAATTGRGNRGRKSVSQTDERLVSALRRASELLAS